jgi:MFS family permease
MLLAATVASLFAGALADRIGRPRAVAVGALFHGIGAVLESGAAALGMFVVGRCIVGIGQGLFLSTLYVYV